jgi:hypothetical protein
MKTEYIQFPIRLESEFYEAIHKKAFDERTSKAKIIRNILKKYFEETNEKNNST